MKIGFIYAGQGAQSVGMGEDLYDNYPVFREAMDKAAEAEGLDFDVRDICFNGPAETLNETKYTQPCMVSFAVAMTKLLESYDIRPAVAAGLSLGEYSALYASGVFTEEQVMSLIAYRGKVMQEAAAGRDCKMIAVIGMDKDSVKEGCRKVAEELPGLVAEPANFNCPGQITVSGDSAAVDRAAEVLKEMGAKRCLPVKVSGPFHTSLMKPAGDALAERFKTEAFGEMTFPVIFNCVGREKTEDETIPALLERQVQSSVYFDDTLKLMAEMGVEMLVEIGPGTTLSKFAAKTVPDVPVYSVSTAADVEKLLEAVK